ncbi:PilX N-terminal domain-containing pilus assembly protein [Alcanivorax sp. DP30]|uniref:pilus assembly PilX family protein n=1 Tax=Alcanivorax sp. DP30 TaxID=2606217 RepID=UPI0013692B2F|nr:PilX N-terminal domain-containing pilus assembly protein [Alcanivorax sp. DP30]MZR61360.1 hypothetical protein [Alcanivorax sp. DP30]
MKSELIKLHRQQGAALMVALMILVVVSLLGLSAMKSSVFSAKVATGTQADAMTFEAAETALIEAYEELSDLSGEDLYAQLSGSNSLQRCVSKSNTSKEGVCGNNDYLDSRGLLRAASTSRLDGYEPIEGSQISTTGGGAVFVDYKIAMLGESEMKSFNLDNHHLQEALKRGIKPGSEIE